MQLQTILNRVEKYKSFVYGRTRLVENPAGRPTVEVEVRARANGRATCSGCGRKGPGYDRLPERRFEFVPLWGMAVYFLYALRRVDCPHCGVTVEAVPWCRGKQRHTRTYQWFLAQWARRLSWQETARVFGTSWQSVYEAVKLAVIWGWMHDTWKKVRTLGIDEIAWRKGHSYLTLAYQLDEGRKRLLWVGQEREQQTLERFFDCLGAQASRKVRFVCSDMWQPYVQVIAQRARQAVHVLDRFHIMRLMNKAIDEVRRTEVKRLERDGYEPILKHARWCLLKRKENRTVKQTVKLKELLQYNLQSVKGHLQREDFQQFWEYQSPTWAGKFLDDWCTRVMRTRLEPMKKVARTLRTHRDLILNWFKAEGRLSAGTVEGFNNKAKLTMRKAYGFRSPNTAIIALYHTLSDLPTPKFTHEFW
jgi:transposase